MRWSWSYNGRILEMGWGADDHFPQVAALHTDSSYYRMNYGPSSGWGTSVILLPSFWERGRLQQGAPVAAQCTADAKDLVVTLQGAISGLSAQVVLRLHPPGSGSFSTDVRVDVTGTAELDPRPGEAYKLVTLSSMHISPTQWDAQSATADGASFPIPVSAWIVWPAVRGSRFGLTGGTSASKANAPTIEVFLDRQLDIAGWVTPRQDVSQDNVAFWAAADTVVRSWQYRLEARP